MENTIKLSSAQLSRLRDLVNDRQDELFEKLQDNTAEKREERAQALRESLKFWDAIDVAVRDACATAGFNEQRAGSSE